MRRTAHPAFLVSVAPGLNGAMDDLPQIEPMIRKLGAEVSQATDVFAVNALRNLLFAGLVGGGVDAVDLIAIDIQRQYDVGLGSLNQTRKAIGLNPYNSISDLVTTENCGQSS